MIALVGPVIGVVLTLVVAGRRDARTRFGGEKRTIYADFLTACARLRDTAVWSSTSEPGEDTGPLLQRIRDTAMHAALTAHRDVGRQLTGVLASAKQLAEAIEDVRRTSKPGHRGTVDERHRAPYDAAMAALSTTLNEFTNAARLDLNVRSPMSPPFPLTDSGT